MGDKNKHNIHYFQSSSMHELYEYMQNWQSENQKRFLSMSVQKDGNEFCCIALTNPTEVVITSENGRNHADVNCDGLEVVVMGDVTR